MILTSLTRFRDYGLLLMRVGLGLMFLYHGIPKLAGGPERWATLGAAMGTLGIKMFPVFWGFMAGVSEAIGGLLLVLGLFFRPATALLAFTMLVAALTMLRQKGLFEASHAIEVGIVFAGLFLVGPGRFSIDKQ